MSFHWQCFKDPYRCSQCFVLANPLDTLAKKKSGTTDSCKSKLAPDPASFDGLFRIVPGCRSAAQAHPSAVTDMCSPSTLAVWNWQGDVLGSWHVEPVHQNEFIHPGWHSRLFTEPWLWNPKKNRKKKTVVAHLQLPVVRFCTQVGHLQLWPRCQHCREAFSLDDTWIDCIGWRRWKVRPCSWKRKLEGMIGTNKDIPWYYLQIWNAYVASVHLHVTIYILL